MSVIDARSVKLKTQQEIQLSPQAKASDIYFADGIDLQTKYQNGGLVDRNALSWINTISPTVTVIKNTDTEFRLQIKSISGTITTPNLKGATAEQLAAQIQASVEELEQRISSLPDIEDINRRFNEVANDIEVLSNSMSTLQETVGTYDDSIAAIQRKNADQDARLQTLEIVMETKADRSDVVDTYTKMEINNKLAAKMNQGDAYSKQEIDELLGTINQEFPSTEDFPDTGTSGKLYIDDAEDMLYRWDDTEGKYVVLCGNSINDALTDADIDTLF